MSRVSHVVWEVTQQLEKEVQAIESSMQQTQALVGAVQGGL